jgi:hypothetical protein
MKLNVNYRLTYQIYYNRIKLDVPDDYKDLSLILQDCRFQIQKQECARVVAMYIDKSDIKKFKIIEDV